MPSPPLIHPVGSFYKCWGANTRRTLPCFAIRTTETNSAKVYPLFVLQLSWLLHYMFQWWSSRRALAGVAVRLKIASNSSQLLRESTHSGKKTLQFLTIIGRHRSFRQPWTDWSLSGKIFIAKKGFLVSPTLESRLAQLKRGAGCLTVGGCWCWQCWERQSVTQQLPSSSAWLPCCLLSLPRRPRLPRPYLLPGPVV